MSDSQGDYTCRDTERRLRTRLERQTARIRRLTEALEGLVGAWPKCGVKGCDRPRTNPAYCDEHRSPGTNDDVYVPALRAAVAELEDGEEE